MLCVASGNNNNNGNSGSGSTCPSNSVFNGLECICNEGYMKFNGLCVLNQNSMCNQNSFDNGLGFCLCMTGYYKVNGTCVIGKPCPPSSTRNQNGECICDPGLTKFNDYCAKCPLGATFDLSTQKCIYVCG